MTKTVEQLRHRIDSGKTGDKIPYPDPAAAPLGTDEEAAGQPVPGSAVEQAIRAESRRPQHETAQQPLDRRKPGQH